MSFVNYFFGTQCTCICCQRADFESLISPEIRSSTPHYVAATDRIVAEFNCDVFVRRRVIEEIAYSHNVRYGRSARTRCGHANRSFRSKSDVKCGEQIESYGFCWFCAFAVKNERKQCIFPLCEISDRSRPISLNVALFMHAKRKKVSKTTINRGGSTLGPGGHRPPKCWPASPPPNILVPTAKIRIVKI